MEQNDTTLSCNSLADVVEWSKRGYIVVLNEGQFYNCYCRPEYVSTDKMVQIDFSREYKSLMEEGEWPWYLLDSGCVRITRDDFLKLNIRNSKTFTL